MLAIVAGALLFSACGGNSEKQAEEAVEPIDTTATISAIQSADENASADIAALSDALKSGDKTTALQIIEGIQTQIKDLTDGGNSVGAVAYVEQVKQFIEQNKDAISAITTEDGTSAIEALTTATNLPEEVTTAASSIYQSLKEKAVSAVANSEAGTAAASAVQTASEVKETVDDAKAKVEDAKSKVESAKAAVESAPAAASAAAKTAKEAATTAAKAKASEKVDEGASRLKSKLGI